jgi:hypothetical protein
MATTTLTPNMNLIVPTPGTNGEPGPNYAYDQNQDLSILDSHNHSPGSGVQVTPAGLNINANLTFQNNQATNVYGIMFSSPATNTQTTFLYTAPQSGGGIDDLFYNDGAGNVIALTKAGLVNATIASLPGESYAGGTFTWKQGAGSTTPANFDIGSITIRPNTAGTTNGVVLGPPSGIASQYNVQLPAVPASATSFMTLDTSGNMAANIAVVGGLTTTNLAANTITGSNIANTNSITRSQTVGPFTTVMSTSSSAFSTNSAYPTWVNVGMTGLTVTTFGGPVLFYMTGDGSSEFSTLSHTGGGQAYIRVVNNTSSIEIFRTEFGSGFNIPPGSIMCIDTTVVGTPGTYTYIVDAAVNISSNTLAVQNCIGVVRELY